MIFAKTSKGASRLSEQFRNHEVEKTYHAVVLGKMPQKKGLVFSHLKKIKIKIKLLFTKSLMRKQKNQSCLTKLSNRMISILCSRLSR